MKRFWLKENGGDWREVSKEEWVRAERAAGFKPKSGGRDEPATSSFGSVTKYGKIEGQIQFDSSEDNPAFSGMKEPPK